MIGLQFFSALLIMFLGAAYHICSLDSARSTCRNESVAAITDVSILRVDEQSPQD